MELDAFILTHYLPRYFKNKEESFVDKNGKTIFFSIKEFAKSICEKNNCFICGTSAKTSEFNEEHIFPTWLLKQFKIHNHKFVSSGQSEKIYGNLTLRCCESCNSLMGELFENKLSEIFKSKSPISELKKVENAKLLLNWLALIFIKSHLNDKFQKIYDDKGNYIKLSKDRDWIQLHHIHCLSRIFYSGCNISPEVFGRLIVMPALNAKDIEPFDYCDSFDGSCLMIRINDLVIFYVFNDCGASFNCLKEGLFDKISGTLDPLQIREIFSRILATNLALKNRPQFSTLIKCANYCEIVVERDSAPFFEPIPDDHFGYYFDFYSSQYKLSKENRQLVKKGKCTFILDKKGKFIQST
ncbi:MAG: hypothetical protein ACOCRX_05790 [Candidatus Woesearchaeota archaeon]